VLLVIPKKKLLRLVAVPKDVSSISDSDNTSDSDSPVCPRGFPKLGRGLGRHMHGGGGHGGYHGCHGGYGFHGGHGHFQGGHGGCHGREHRHGGHGHGWGPEMFKARLTSKRDFIKSKLDELEKVTEKTPEQQQKVLRLQFKLKKIENHLERGCWEKKGKGKHCGKWADKMEKRRQKMEGQDPKQLIVELSNLKEKRKALKNEIRPLKEKIRELKYASC